MTEQPTTYLTHNMGNGMHSPCGLMPAWVYSGYQAAFTSGWSEVDCPKCLAHKPGTERVGDPTPRTFYVTFGGMYRHDEHPYWPGAHPDGWLEVDAPDEEAARLLVREYIGTKWAFMYDEARFHRQYMHRGRLAMISTEGVSWSAAGVAHPERRFNTSSPEFYGTDSNEVVAARIEGELMIGSDQDALDNVGYEVELVHKGCLTQGLALFREVTDVDSRVKAFELDWAQPHHCPVCEESIT